MKEILFKPEESAFIKKFMKELNTPLSKKIYNKLDRAEKKIKVSSAKGKGRNLQYWVCERIAKIFHVDFIQSDDECPIHSREMGQHGTDIIVRGEIGKKFPFDVECKSQETLSIPEWIRQAKENNKKEDRDWLVVFKKQTLGSEPFVVMEWDAFERLFCSYNNI